MIRAWWVLLLLLCIRQQPKQQVHTRGTKQQQPQQQQQQQRQQPPGTATIKQQQHRHVKVSGAKQTAETKTTKIGAEIAAGALQGEKLEMKIKALKQELQEAQEKQTKLKEEQLKREKLKAEAEAKAKTEAPKVLYRQPIQTKQEIQKPTNTLRCAKNTNYFCIEETTCCLNLRGGWGCCPKPGVSALLLCDCNALNGLNRFQPCSVSPRSLQCFHLCSIRNSHFDLTSDATEFC